MANWFSFGTPDYSPGITDVMKRILTAISGRWPQGTDARNSSQDIHTAPYIAFTVLCGSSVAP